MAGYLSISGTNVKGAKVHSRTLTVWDPLDSDDTYRGIVNTGPIELPTGTNIVLIDNMDNGYNRAIRLVEIKEGETSTLSLTLPKLLYASKWVYIWLDTNPHDAEVYYKYHSYKIWEKICPEGDTSCGQWEIVIHNHERSRVWKVLKTWETPMKSEYAIDKSIYGISDDAGVFIDIRMVKSGYFEEIYTIALAPCGTAYNTYKLTPLTEAKDVWFHVSNPDHKFYYEKDSEWVHCPVTRPIRWPTCPLKLGTHRIKCEAPGYETRIFTITLNKDGVTSSEEGVYTSFYLVTIDRLIEKGKKIVTFTSVPIDAEVKVD